MQKVRVFIVDDSIVARKMLIRILEKKDDIEIVGEASTGQGGIIMLDECDPDIIFIEADVGGGMKIEDVVNEVKKLNQEISVVLCMDPKSVSRITLSSIQGVDDFISKPYIKQKIYGTIDELLNRKMND